MAGLNGTARAVVSPKHVELASHGDQHVVVTRRVRKGCDDGGEVPPCYGGDVEDPQVTTDPCNIRCPLKYRFLRSVNSR